MRFIAKENGIVPITRKIMLSGMPIPVKEKTAAKGKKIALEGICRRIRPAIEHFCLPVNFALGELGLDTGMGSVSTSQDFISLEQLSTPVAPRNCYLGWIG